MDVVEAVGRECPLLLAVVDLELDVRREPRGLDRRQVRPDDLAVRVLIPHIAAIYSLATWADAVPVSKTESFTLPINLRDMVSVNSANGCLGRVGYLFRFRDRELSTG